MRELERIKHFLSYNPETGEFIWVNRPSCRSKIKCDDIAGCINAKGYRVIQIFGTQYYAHRLAWAFVHGVMPNDDIDHINGDKDDNRLFNLRSANRNQNQANIRAPKTNKLGIKGVCKVKDRNLFSAKIVVNGRRKHLGYFKNVENAAEVYAAAAKRYFGEFAKT